MIRKQNPEFDPQSCPVTEFLKGQIKIAYGLLENSPLIVVSEISTYVNKKIVKAHHEGKDFLEKELTEEMVK